MLKFPIYYLEKKEKEKVEHKVSGEGAFSNLSKIAIFGYAVDIYQIWKQSDKDFLSYCENDEISADAAV